MIRKARKDDVPTLQAIERLAFAEDPWTDRMLLEEVEHPAGICLVHDERDGPTGFILCRMVLDECHVHNVAVHPERRRGGIARALLRAAETEAMARGAVVSHLEVAEDNTAARAMYEGSQYAEVGRRARYYHGREAAVLMSRQLVPSL